jgi:hypothetical protein
MTTVLDTISDQNLLAPYFAGPSWDAWRVVLKGTFGEKMTPAERDQFRTLAERDPPPGRVREAFFAVGRRGGKDSICSAIAVHAAVFGDFKSLRPGERPVVLILAATKEQAAGLFSYVAGYFDSRVPMLAPLVQRMGDEIIQLTTGIDIIPREGRADHEFSTLHGDAR